MIEVVGVTFKHNGKIYYFSPNGLKIKKGINVIVKTERGLQFGKVELENFQIEEKKLKSSLNEVVRIASKNDFNTHLKNERDVKKALNKCKELVEKYELNNNIILTDELEYIPKLLNLTNVVLSTAKAEGISANLVKAMVQCKPIIATDVRGNKELLKQKNLVKNTDELIKKMSICINDNKSKEIYETQKYEVENVLQEVFGLYT